MAAASASDAEMHTETPASGSAGLPPGVDPNSADGQQVAALRAHAQAAGAQPAQGPAAPTTQMTPQELAAFANAPAADITMEGLGKMFMHLSVQLQKTPSHRGSPLQVYSASSK